MKRLSNIVRLNPTAGEVFMKCSLRNPLRAPSTMQTVLAFVLNIPFLGIPLFKKSWDLKNESCLFNPTQAHKLEFAYTAHHALESEQISFLELIFEKNCGAFLERIHVIHDKFQSLSENAVLSEMQKKELLQLHRLLIVVKKKGSLKGFKGCKKWIKISRLKWVMFDKSDVHYRTPAGDALVPIHDFVKIIEKNLQPYWDKVNPSLL